MGAAFQPAPAQRAKKLDARKDARHTGSQQKVDPGMPVLDDKLDTQAAPLDGTPAYLRDGTAGARDKAAHPGDDKKTDDAIAATPTPDPEGAKAADAVTGDTKEAATKDAKEAPGPGGDKADKGAKAPPQKAPAKDGTAPDAKPAAKGAAGKKGAGRGGGETDDDDDDALDLVDELSDQQAASQLITEWFTEAPVMFDDNPLGARYEGATSIELKVAPPPKQQGDEGAGSNAMSAEDAGREAGQIYAQTAGRARDAHDFMVEEANRGARRVFEQAATAIGRLDLQLQPTLDGIVGTLNFCRRDLEGAVSASEAHLEAEARYARRRAGGAASSGRGAVSASAKRAVDIELPKVRTELREDFVTLYDTTSKNIADSGSKTSDKLHDAGEHKKLLEHPEYADTGNDVERAMNEAARSEIPPRLNHLGDTIKKGCDKNAEQIKVRLDTAPPSGGSSIGKGIDDFIDSMRHNITGDAKGAGAAASARAKAGGATDTAAAAEGTKAAEAISSSGSLESRGHKAIGKSHAEALRSLKKQLAAARKSVRHAKRSGEKQLVTQRSGALTRLAGLRKMRIDAMRETANQAAKALRTGAKGAVAFYSDSTKRLGDSLQRAAERGPAALTETAKQGVPPVATAVADGQKLQAARLGQVTQSAGRSVGRLSDTVRSDAGGAAIGFEKAMSDISRTLGTQVDDAARSHSKYFADVAQGIASTTQGFTQPLPVMFKQTIDDTKKNIKPVYDAEKGAMEKSEKSVIDNNKKMADNPNEHIGDRLRTAKTDRDNNLGARAKAMRAAWGMINLDENALMENARGVTALGGNSVRAKFPGDLDHWLWFEYDKAVGGLDGDEYNAITNYLAGRTDEGAMYELKTTVHWYGNEGKRATKVMEDIGSDARKKLVGRSDWKSMADEVKGGLYGTDKKVFEALEIDRAVLAKAYRSKDSVDTARNKNEKEALFTALTPYQSEAIVNGKVVTAEEQLAEFQQEFAVVIGKAKAPGEISQKEAAEALADYATKPVKVWVEEGYGEHSNMVERTYTLSGPETALARALAITGPNSEETKAARVLHESERTGGKVNLEALENAVIDPRLNPALTPDLTKEQRDMARAQQDQLFVKYAELAKKYGVKVEGETPAELREFVAGRLGAKYGKDNEGELGARYAKSIVLKDRPDAVAAMRYAMERSGTDVGLMRRTLGRLSREEVKTLASDYNLETGKNMYDQLGVYGYSGGEVSGDERLEIEVLLMGFPQNDRERAEVALYKNLQQQRETGVAGKAALSGSIEEQRMLAADADLRRVMGGSLEYDEFNRPVQKGGSFDNKGRYNGPNDTEFLLAVNNASYTAESYAAAIDRLAAGITAIIAVIGAVVAAVLTVVTGGLAAPLMIAALSFGLAGMAANALIRGGRYGWEEALTDLGMVGVQVLTAGVGAQLGAAAKTANAAASAARAGGTAVAKTGLAKLFTGNPLVDQIIIGSITGGIGGVGQTALQAETWKNGLLEGIGNALVGGVRGSLSGAATAAATNGLEALPVGRGAVAAMRAGKDYRSLGSEIGRMSAGGGLIRGTLGVAGRSVARGGLQAVGGAAGRATELAFDTATGKYHGSLTQALDQIGEASLRAGFQGLAEGGGEAFGQRRRDTMHPQEAIDREQHRMKLIAEENAALRGALHADAMEAAVAPPVPELPVVPRMPAKVPATETTGGGARPIAPPEGVAGAAGRPLQAGEPFARPAGPAVEAPGGARPVLPGAETAVPGGALLPVEASAIAGTAARTPIAEEAVRVARPTSGEAADTRPLVKPAAAPELPGAPRIARADQPEQIASAAARRPAEAAAPERAPSARARADEEAAAPKPVSETEGAEGAARRRPATPDEGPALAQAKRTALHEEVEGAAARLVGTEMELAPKKVITDESAALKKALNDIAGEGGPLANRVIADEPHPQGGRRLLVEDANGDPITIRVIVADTEQGNIANFARGKPGEDTYVVMLSPRARETTHARALAHEIEELRFHGLKGVPEGDFLKPRPGGIAGDERLSANARTALGKLQSAEQEMATARAAQTPDSAKIAKLEKNVEQIRTSLPKEASDALQLSAHDRGRLAELQVLDSQLQRARGASPRDEVLVARLEHESQALVAHLGLVSGPAAPARRAAVERIMATKGATGVGRPLSAAMNEAVGGAAANPLLRPRPTSLDDAATLAGQISRARALGNAALADELTLLARSMVRERFGDGVPGDAQAVIKTLEAALLRNITDDNDRNAVSALIADVADRESARSRAIAADNRARRAQGELDAARVEADPRNLAKLKAEIAVDQDRLSGVSLSKKELEQRKAEITNKLPKATAAERTQLLADFNLIDRQLQGARLPEYQVQELRAKVAAKEADVKRIEAAAPDLPARIAQLETETRRFAGEAETAWAHANRREGEKPKAVPEAPVRDKALATEDDLAKLRKPDPRRDEAEHALIRQRYGDIPGFQEFSALLDAYYARYPDRRKLRYDDRMRDENMLFGEWSRGRYFSPETGRTAQLEELRYLPASRGKAPDELQTQGAPKLRPTDTVDVPKTTRPLQGSDADSILAEIAAQRNQRGLPAMGEAEQTLLRALLIDPDANPPKLSVAQTEELSIALVTVRNKLQAQVDAAPEATRAGLIDRLASVETAIRDVREALGVAAGRAAMQKLFPNQPEIMEGKGANTVDLAVGDIEQGPVIVCECKGRAAAGRGSRIASVEGTGETVRAEQGTPEYLRSVAQAMQPGPNADTGAAIQEGMATGTPKVRYVIVRQEILPDGSLGQVKILEYGLTGT